MKALSVHTPIGWLRLREEDGVIVESALVCAPADERSQPTPLLLEAERQLEAYFRREVFAFDLPISARGTEFEEAVWNALRQIPYGQTRAYGEIAAQIGKQGAARAVGRACGKNPLLVLVPCHRVIGSGGKLTGFAAGLQVKKALLSLEGVRAKE